MGEHLYYNITTILYLDAYRKITQVSAVRNE